jgi:hypothetical protein
MNIQADQVAAALAPLKRARSMLAGFYTSPGHCQRKPA